MKIYLLAILIFLTIPVLTFAQKWQPGYFNDVKNNKVEGLIQAYPSGKGPIKGQGFILYKETDKSPEIKLSANDVKWFVAGKDSFAVAHPPMGETWPNELDFVRVVLDEPLKLYAFKGGKGGSGGGVHLSPGLGVGIGGGSYAGGGLGISFGGGGGGKNRSAYYFGATTAELTQLNNENFEDVMAEIMGDEPQVVDAIRSHHFGLSNIDKLVAYFKQVQASHQ